MWIECWPLATNLTGDVLSQFSGHFRQSHKLQCPNVLTDLADRSRGLLSSESPGDTRQPRSDPRGSQRRPPAPPGDGRAGSGAGPPAEHPRCQPRWRPAGRPDLNVQCVSGDCQWRPHLSLSSSPCCRQFQTWSHTQATSRPQSRRAKYCTSRRSQPSAGSQSVPAYCWFV